MSASNTIKSDIISKTHSEWVQNKPSVKSFMNDKLISILVDNDAEFNIINAGLLSELKSVNRNIKLRDKPWKYFCAYGSSITVQGVTTLDITIGTKKWRWILKLRSMFFPK